MINLTRPLIFFDLETTGTKISTDRIIQIGCIKLLPDGTREIRNILVNPEVIIPLDASMVHGITNEMVENQPLFSSLAGELAERMSGCDLAGYNSDTFDIPLLAQEFARCNISWPEENTRSIDILTIERSLNSHKLTHTYQRYTGKTLDDAHDALSDAQATLEVWQGQLTKLNDHESLDSIVSWLSGNRKRYDIAGKMYYADGNVYWSFGKYRDKPVDHDLDYCQWVMTSDFPMDTKVKLQEWINK